MPVRASRHPIVRCILRCGLPSLVTRISVVSSVNRPSYTLTLVLKSRLTMTELSVVANYKGSIELALLAALTTLTRVALPKPAH